jgi:hypothetical protein
MRVRVSRRVNLQKAFETGINRINTDKSIHNGGMRLTLKINSFQFGLSGVSVFILFICG